MQLFPSDVRAISSVNAIRQMAESVQGRHAWFYLLEYGSKMVAAAASCLDGANCRAATARHTQLLNMLKDMRVIIETMMAGTDAVTSQEPQSIPEEHQPFLARTR
jgi:hypothetical protein